MNKKGFSLVELIVSFVIISLLSVVLFRTVMSLQEKQLRNLAYNNYITLNSTLNSIIQDDVTNKIITELDFCGRNCYKFTYADATTKTLTIDIENKLFKYGALSERLPASFSFYRDIEVQEEIVDGMAEGLYNSMLIIRIPISSTILPGDLDIIYLYQYDNRINPIKSTLS